MTCIIIKYQVGWFKIKKKKSNDAIIITLIIFGLLAYLFTYDISLLTLLFIPSPYYYIYIYIYIYRLLFLSDLYIHYDLGNNLYKMMDIGGFFTMKKRIH